MEVLELAKKLIAFKTVTPENNGIMEFIQEFLLQNSFETVIIKEFSDINPKAKNTFNLYASRFKNCKDKNLCFAGHVDVVPEGKESLWKFPPFSPVIEDDILYGRGASDMKCAIAAFLYASFLFFKENPDFKGGNVSILLTGDEEDNGINGTIKMLKFLHKESVKIDDVILGEPTSEKLLGDTIKIGRRGSVSFFLEIFGIQGHIAYPDFAKNPIKSLSKVINALLSLRLDEGTPHFQSSNLEIIKVGPEQGANNIIPASATCFFNIRFNNIHTGASLVEKIRNLLQEVCDLKFKLTPYINGESFLNEKVALSSIAMEAVKEISGIDSKFSTSGGTSDARFIKEYARVIELGMLNATAHKVDENCPVADIISLSKIYNKILEKYFFSK